MRSKPAVGSGIPALLCLAVVAGCGDDGADRRASDAVPAVAAATSAQVPDFDRIRKAEKLSTGITVSYFEAGDPDGEVVIMLHGWTDTSRSFYPLIETLVTDSTWFHIYALDQRGHGAASMPEAADCAAIPEACFEMTDFRDDLLAFMDARNIRAAHLVGHSLGTLVAQELALSNPDRVESLVLIGTAVSGADNAVFLWLRDELIEGRKAGWRGSLEEAAPGFRWPADAYELTPADADPNVEEFLKNVWVTELAADPAFLAAIVPETAQIRIGTWVGALRGLIGFSSRGRLRRLAVPTLVIWGTQDVLFPRDPDQLDVLAELDAAVEACRLPYYFHKTYGREPLPADEVQTDLGHNTHWGAHKGIAADITAWITAQAPTTELSYANPGTAGSVLTETGAAVIVEGRQPAACTSP